MHYYPQNLKQGLKDTRSLLHFQLHRLSTKSISHARNIKHEIGMKNPFSDWEEKQGRKKIPLASDDSIVSVFLVPSVSRLWLWAGVSGTRPT